MDATGAIIWSILVSRFNGRRGGKRRPVDVNEEVAELNGYISRVRINWRLGGCN